MKILLKQINLVMTPKSDEFSIMTILAWSQNCRYTESQLYNQFFKQASAKLSETITKERSTPPPFFEEKSSLLLNIHTFDIKYLYTMIKC